MAQLAVHRAAAQRLDLTLVEKPVRSEEEARATITGFRKGDADGMFSLRFLSSNIPGLILDLAPRVPTMFTSALFVERGGLVSYAANLYELGKQAARLVDRVLKGTPPADLPIEQSTKFELVINLKTARRRSTGCAPSRTT